MRLLPEIVGSRREFFRAAGRYSLLAMITAAAAMLMRRGKNSEKCINRGICSGCAVFNQCGLPAALSAKQAG